MVFLNIHTDIFIKVLTQAALFTTIGVIYFLFHYFFFHLPKKRKKHKFEEKYPVTSKAAPLECLSLDDIVLLKSYGEAIFDKRERFGKRNYVVWIKKPEQNIRKTFTEEELLDEVQSIRCKFGVKWERK